VATKYIFAGNLRIAKITSSDTQYFHKDHLQSSTAVTNDLGEKLEATEYFPFGLERSHTGSRVSNYKYTDQELDVESGLYNYDARLYDPVIVRFVSPDTIIQKMYNPQTLDRYSYVSNNPLNYIDPTGHAKYRVFFTNISVGEVYGVTQMEGTVFSEQRNPRGYYGAADFSGIFHGPEVALTPLGTSYQMIGLEDNYATADVSRIEGPASYWASTVGFGDGESIGFYQFGELHSPTGKELTWDKTKKTFDWGFEYKTSEGIRANKYYQVDKIPTKQEFINMDNNPIGKNENYDNKSNDATGYSGAGTRQGGGVGGTGRKRNKGGHK